jgi:transcriptional regulator with XRE-family HTH domain
MATRFGSALREARRARGLSLRGLQALVRYDFTYLGQVERGEKPGSLALATVCDDALTAGGRLAELFQGCECFIQENVLEDVAGLSRGRVTGSSGEFQTHLRGAMRRKVPSGMERLRTLYHGTYSIADLVSCVAVLLLANSQNLADARGTVDRQRLLIERADAALLAGRLALFDTWAPVEARGHLVAAWEAAVEAEDDALAAGVFGHLAFVPAREGTPRAGAAYLRLARRHAERSGVPAIVSWAGAVEAEILGPHLQDGGIRALDRAVDDLHRSPHAPIPAWFDYYSPARLDGFRGQVLLAAGRAEAARDALTRALADLEPHAVKQRAVLLADLAASGLCGPDPDIEQVAAEALQAATELGRTRYQAAAERLAALRARLVPWRRTRAVRELDDLLSEHVA